MEKLDAIEVDQFGIVKIFPDDQNPKTYVFRLGTWGRDDEDRDHFNGRTYGSCRNAGGSDPNDPRKSVISTEWEKSNEEFVDQEVTGYFYLPQRESDASKTECYKFERFGKGSALSIKLRGSHHSNTSDESAHCYIFDFQYEGGDRKNFQKEAPHGNYKKKDAPAKFSLPSLMKKWVGFKVLTINQGSGVRCLAFADFGSQNRSKEEGPDPSLQNWKLYYDLFDDGNMDNIPGERFDDNTRPPFIRHHGNKTTQFRMDRILKPEGKFLNVRSVNDGDKNNIDRVLSTY
jgi:hypothetical protein